MTKAEVQSLIDTNLASGSNITATEHRAVETALLNYSTDGGKLFSGSLPIGDVPSGGQSYVISFPYGADDINYVVMGSLVVSSGSIYDSTSCIFTVTDKQIGGFSITIRELTGNVTQVLSFDYAVFKK